MYDQLRFDYLSCAGHPQSAHQILIEWLPKVVRFQCYVQSPVCGGSRMCFYTGRYASSHGAHWNGFPLRVGEYTIGDHCAKCWHGLLVDWQDLYAVLMLMAWNGLAIA